ncbi:MAG: helix-turn-helix transcriptional regulator [Actinomycetota bacterium]
MTPSKTIQRLQRLLSVVPYVVRHPGTPVRDLSKLFDMSEDAILADLNLLFLTGLPPYGPGDLIEVDIDDESRVWIRMADYFSRPVRLTRAEALALYLRGTELLGAGGVKEAEALEGALAKIAEALGGEALGDLQVEVGETATTGPLATVRAAVAAREGLEIEYYSANRDELSTRMIDAEHVFSALGNWYVVAWDRSADGERLFRLDRIREARRTGEGFEPRGLIGQGRDLYSRSAEDIEVRLELAPRARWVAEYYVVSKAEEREGLLEVALPTKDLAWAAKLVLRLGGEARVLEPEELRSLTRELATRTLNLYA